MEEPKEHAIATAPYSNRPPSPPYIPIPMTFAKGAATFTFVPSFNNVDAMRLTGEDLRIITRNKSQTATDRSVGWNYEARRKAQTLLDFLYLGPLSVARNEAWLAKESITMIIVTRHSRMAQARLMSVDKVAQKLGIHVEYLDVLDNSELIHSFPEVVTKINSHLVDVYRSQAMSVHEGQMAIDEENFRSGKILLVCETGNDRSAFVAAAYIMNMYGKDMVSTVQFISMQRFSANFDEDGKRMLRTYEDILNAQRNVFSATRDVPRAGQSSGNSGGRSKRGIETTLDEEDRQGGGYETFAADRERYQDRSKFVPFRDPDMVS
ncbi:dual specificity phosphatase [Colletotrichum orchidophilum]|uniref:Dual specificity phosphatase n=1 Tax=Colletotrichum orchidophilum TaxID=1209926 RepID=A0A1G4B2Q6_9PEZI|nr:dual specificity phosphatase [Colletotrichum orchidophilum]OHE95708.1 dual specificity phosphatase [Colletotrichum orchidophilum]